MRFTKMQGVGNDFVVLDGASLEILAPESLAIRLCDRHTGIGADGLLIATRLNPRPFREDALHALRMPSPVGERSLAHAASGKEPKATPLDPPASGGRQDLRSEPVVAMRMFNPDGTEDMCGNGLRCIGLYAVRHGWLNAASEFLVATKEGPRRVRVICVAADGSNGAFGVDMGVPRWDAASIPFAAEPSAVVRDYPLSVGGREFVVTSLNTGSTHTVIFGPQPSDDTFFRYSPLIECHPLFPERTSVLWAAIDVNKKRVDTRIWERGAGETLGCGTGACAVAVAAQQAGLVPKGSALKVASRGGELVITWPGDSASIDMAGPAQFVFEGDVLFG